jgi:hypothetical protein
VVLAATASPARADEPRSQRSFSSGGGRYELVPTDARRATWTLWDRATGEARYELRDDVKDWWKRKDERFANAQVPGELASQTVLVSEDGTTVVALNDWPESLEAPGERGAPDLPWLRFYREGALVKAYRRSEFLRNDCSLSQSVSHYRWLLEPVPGTFPPRELVFTTSDLTTFRLDAHTGALLAREIPGELRTGALLVMGEVRKRGPGKRAVVVSRAIVGAASAGDVIDFAVAEGDPLVTELDASIGRGPVSLVVDDGKLHPLTRRVLRVLFSGGGTCR